jgi:hypothetical protein
MNLDLVVRVMSFLSLPDEGPKSHQMGRTLPTVSVDMHSFNLLQLIDFIAKHYLYGDELYEALVEEHEKEWVW